MKKALLDYSKSELKELVAEMGEPAFRAGQIYAWLTRCVPFEELVDTKCRAYEELYMAYITPAAREEKLLDHPELFRAPIIRNGREATVGYKPEVWEKWE